jgi:hypothetical protein
MIVFKPLAFLTTMVDVGPRDGSSRMLMAIGVARAHAIKESDPGAPRAEREGNLSIQPGRFSRSIRRSGAVVQSSVAIQ